MINADVQLIQRTLDGDDTAFSELVSKYQKSVHALAWRKTQDFHIAEDITQETFLRAYRNLSTLKEPHSFASWLYVITVNYCNTWLGKKSMQSQSLARVSNELEKTTYSKYIIEENERVSEETQREVVKKLLEKLQESERTVITLHYLGGMTYEEISKFLGVSVSAIKNRLYRARQLLKKEETMIREALENYQITPHLTENIMREIARLKPATPTGSNPLVPWAIAASGAILIVLLLGLGIQRLVHFQKPFSLDAQAETTIEIVETPFVQNLNAKPDIRKQLGSFNAQDQNNGDGQQNGDAASLDLDTIIAKIKQYDNAVSSVTGDFIIERHRNFEISGKPPPFGNLSIERNIEPKIEKTEYRMTFDDGKVRVDWEQGVRPIMLWDGKQNWEVSSPGPHNLLFKVEITPNKETTVQEKIKQAFKQVGIELADDASIVKGELPNSFRIIEKDKTYFVLFVGETVLEVYKHNVEYAVRPHWAIDPDDGDPRWWLTFPSDGSDNTYLSQSLWQLLEKHETEILGRDVLEGGEKTTVIRLTIPALTIGNSKTRPQHLKLWISHDKGFRLVKSEEEYIEQDTSEWSPFKVGVTYINTRKIEYHEYMPDAWFPKRIEKSIVPKASSDKQNGESVLFKDVFITKQCQLNTDVSKLLRLDITPETPVYDFGVNRLHTVGDLKTKPNFQMQHGRTSIPNKTVEVVGQVSDAFFEICCKSTYQKVLKLASVKVGQVT